MKKILFIICLIFTTTLLFATSKKDEKIEITVKTNARGGGLVPSHETVKILKPGPSWGGEIDVEFPSTRKYPWQQYFGDPTIGVGLVYMNLGAELLGNCVAIYPYFL